MELTSLMTLENLRLAGEVLGVLALGLGVPHLKTTLALLDAIIRGVETAAEENPAFGKTVKRRIQHQSAKARVESVLGRRVQKITRP